MLDINKITPMSKEEIEYLKRHYDKYISCTNGHIGKKILRLIKTIEVSQFKAGQIVRIKDDGFIRKILDIRNGEALTEGADGKVGYIALEKLELVPLEELETYKNS